MVVCYQVGKTREAIGLDGEVVNRRRTISGPVTELVEAARREQPTPSAFPPPSTQPESVPLPVNSSPPNPPSSPHPSSGGSGSSSENLPFAEEGSLTIRRQGRGEGEGQVAIYIYLLCLSIYLVRSNVLRIHSQLLCSVRFICVNHISLSMFLTVCAKITSCHECMNFPLVCILCLSAG